MNTPQTDRELVAFWRHAVDRCQVDHPQDWHATSLHISAGALDRLCALAEKTLSQWPDPDQPDPDTKRLVFGDAPFRADDEDIDLTAPGTVGHRWHPGDPPDNYLGDNNGD